jgi:hypothetical protein
MIINSVDIMKAIEREREFTVWVGGTEVTDCYVSEDQAKRIAEMYKAKGYKDVIVEEY